MTSIISRLRDIIASYLSHLYQRIDYLAYYPYSIASQNDDLTLNITSTDRRMPDLQNVPIRYGLPGVLVTVNEGGQVLVGFEGGSPQAPFAMVWQDAAVKEISITTSEKVKFTTPKVELTPDGRKLALNGDLVLSGLPNVASPITVMFGLAGTPPITIPPIPGPLTAANGVGVGIPYTMFFYKDAARAAANLPSGLVGSIQGTSVHRG